jgi:hypothetical protein
VPIRLDAPPCVPQVAAIKPAGKAVLRTPSASAGIGRNNKK